MAAAAPPLLVEPELVRRRRRPRRASRALALFVGLMVVFSASALVPSRSGERYAPDETRELLSAASIVHDGDLNVRDEYRTRAYAGFFPRPLAPRGRLVGDRLVEPVGLGFVLLIAPAYALGGPLGVELWLAALTALAFVLAAALARRLVPEPWATAAPVLCALSPPVLAHATAIDPAVPGATLLVGAALLALRVREAPFLRFAVPAASALALEPWLAPTFAVPAVLVLVALVRWLARRGRRASAITAGEIGLFSAVVYVGVSRGLYGGLTPFSADLAPRRAPDALELLTRAPRVLGLWLDRPAGLLHWAPVALLSGYTVVLLWRSRRERVAEAVPERMDVEVGAALLVVICGVQLLVAGLGAGAVLGPGGLPGRGVLLVVPVAAALAAWGLRQAPRLGAALGALGLVASAWLVLAIGLDGGGWAAPPGSAPWGPLDLALPRWGAQPGTAIAAGVALALLAALLVIEGRRGRSL